MSEGEHFLVIPVVGMPRLDYTTQITPEQVVDPTGSNGVVSVNVHDTTIYMSGDLDLPTNQRARTALAEATGLHFLLTGTIALTGLTPEQIVAILRAIG